MIRPVPARLRRLTIRDFRKIDHLEIELPLGDGHREGALVLAGDNGVGKTSVLEAILLLFGRLDLLPPDTASPRDLVRLGAADFHVEGDVRVGTRVLKWQVNRAGVESLDARLRRAGEASSYGTAVARDALDEVLRDHAWGGFGPSDFAVEYLSAQRDAVGAFPGTTRCRVAEIKRRLASADRLHRPEHDVALRIETFMRTFFGDRWALDVTGGQVVVRDGAVPIDRLSSGETALLAMTYPFVFGDRAPDLVLLDEPEQHMHEDWQWALLPALRDLSPSTQFVVTTHSSWVLDAVTSYERAQLTPSDEPHTPLTLEPR